MQLRKGDLEKAQPLLESVLQRDPDNRQALELMAGLELMQGKSALAVEKLERLVALQPDSADLRSKLGLALMAQGEVDPATAELEKAIALEPGTDEHELRLDRIELVGVHPANQGRDKILQQGGQGDGLEAMAGP
jgi:Tfp pilus assembly protein PilF